MNWQTRVVQREDGGFAVEYRESASEGWSTAPRRFLSGRDAAAYSAELRGSYRPPKNPHIARRMWDAIRHGESKA